VDWRELELRSPDSVGRAAVGSWDGVAHLAAVASAADARKDPGLAWEVNAGGTARLLDALDGREGIFLLISTGEVYGQGSGATRREEDPLLPVSPYAATKVGAEIAAWEAARRRGARVIVARPFTHTGPGQDTRFVIPALAQRLRLARRIGAAAINTGNLEPVRDLLDVRDVAAAYLALLSRGEPGATYNIVSGTGHRLRDILDRLQAILGTRVIAEYDPSLARRADILHLVGNAERLRAATGWAPERSLDQTLQDLVDAQAD
jgi:GDP-4-dehydro-6-deoxy-D-mannose reductase